MDEHWETLTFGDLVPGDVVRTDQEIHIAETVEAVALPWDSPNATRSHGHHVRFATDHGWVYTKRVTDPVLVRFPRPEEEA